MRIMKLARRALLCFSLALVTACSSPPSPQEQIANQEISALAPLKTKYPDVVMGFDVHGPGVDISIDLNGLISMDEPKEDAMKSEALTRWRDAWTAAHPHEHATLTVRFIDFKGNPESKQTVKV
jgi:hypothetical protein